MNLSKQIDATNLNIDDNDHQYVNIDILIDKGSISSPNQLSLIPFIDKSISLN